MYQGLKLFKVSRPNGNLLYHYTIVDPEFPNTVEVQYKEHIQEREKDHVNTLLYKIYYLYKDSKYPVCININRVIDITFPSPNKVRETAFYKQFHSLIERTKC